MRIWNLIRKLHFKYIKQRQVKKFDQVPEEYLQSDKAVAGHFKSGHRGILTVNEEAPNAKYTTYKDDFIQRDIYDPNGEPQGEDYKHIKNIFNRIF